MRLLLVLLGIMCFNAGLKVSEKLGWAIASNADTSSLWALFIAMNAGLIGCVFGFAFYSKK